MYVVVWLHRHHCGGSHLEVTHGHNRHQTLQACLCVVLVNKRRVNGTQKHTHARKRTRTICTHTHAVMITHIYTHMNMHTYTRAYTYIHTHARASTHKISYNAHSSQFLPTFSPVKKTCSVAVAGGESEEEDCSLALSCKRGRVAERRPELRELWEDQATARENWRGQGDKTVS